LKTGNISASTTVIIFNGRNRSNNQMNRLQNLDDRLTATKINATLTSKNSHWRSTAKTALSISLTLGLVLLSSISPGVTQERKPPRTLTSSGRGIITIPTTISQIRLAIEVQGKTPSNTQQEAAKRSARVMAYLKAQQVDKLQTTGINLNPNYIYSPNGGNPQISGYTASNSISFQVPTDRAGSILDAAVQNGASRIDGVSFVASEKAIESAQFQALKQATLDAQRQADAVLGSLNLQRKEPIGIQINSTSSPSPIPMPTAMMQVVKVTATAAPTTPVVGGEQQVEATVTVDFSY
jgi:uncharacterized protein